jgi:hypothetical protein
LIVRRTVKYDKLPAYPRGLLCESYEFASEQYSEVHASHLSLELEKYAI